MRLARSGLAGLSLSGIKSLRKVLSPSSSAIRMLWLGHVLSVLLGVMVAFAEADVK